MKSRTADHLKRLTAFGFVGCLDLIHAAAQLAIARWTFGKEGVPDILADCRVSRNAGHAPLEEADEKLVRRVRHAISLVAPRLPWRADCLIQAMAAQRWLDRNGIPTSLSIGVRKPQPGPFEAHAWLTHGDFIVTGGSASDFTPLLDPEQGHPRREGRKSSRIA